MSSAKGRLFTLGLNELSWKYTTLWYSRGTFVMEETTAEQLVTPHVSECEGHVVLTNCSLNTYVTDTV